MAPWTSNILCFANFPIIRFFYVERQWGSALFNDIRYVFWHSVYPNVSIRAPRVVGLRKVKKSSDKRWNLYAPTMMEFRCVERCREYQRGKRCAQIQGQPVCLSWYIEGLLCRYAEQLCMAFITSCGAVNNEWLLVTPEIARLSMSVKGIPTLLLAGLSCKCRPTSKMR